MAREEDCSDVLRRIEDGTTSRRAFLGTAAAAAAFSAVSFRERFAGAIESPSNLAASPPAGFIPFAAPGRIVKVTNRVDAPVLVLSQLGPAALPTTPTNPRGTVAVAAVALGLILAIFAALAAGALRRFVAADEVSERLGLPVLGEVPVLVHAGADPADMFTFMRDERGLEAFQQLRSYLHVMFQDTHPVIAFTSCAPREGKSSVVANTAWALATPGHFVVAVDGDLRQPKLHEIFGVDLSPGVSDIAVANGPSDLLALTGNPCLELIPAGVPLRHPADIAASDVPRLLRALRESDRTVVLDCPPITGVAEATLLVAKADAVILVVDARIFNFELLEQGLAQLRASGANVVGIVLNRVRRRKMPSTYQYDPSPQVEEDQKAIARVSGAAVSRLPRSG